MFDRLQKIPVRLLRQDGDIRTQAAFPSDEQIIQRAVARKIISTDLGRGQEKADWAQPDFDLRLAEELIEMENSGITQREAERLIFAMLEVEVLDCQRGVGGFEASISHRTFGLQTIVVKVPTSGQLEDFERQYAVKKFVSTKQRSLQFNHKISAEIWAQIGQAVDIPINWKSAIIQAVKEKIDELSLGTDDPT